MICYASEFIWIQICRYILYRGFGKWILNMNHNGSCIRGFQHWVRRDWGGLDEMIETLGALVRADWTMVGDRVDLRIWFNLALWRRSPNWNRTGFWAFDSSLDSESESKSLLNPNPAELESKSCWTGIKILLNPNPIESRSCWIQIGPRGIRREYEISSALRYRIPIQAADSESYMDFGFGFKIGLGFGGRMLELEAGRMSWMLDMDSGAYWETLGCRVRGRWVWTGRKANLAEFGLLLVAITGKAGARQTGQGRAGTTKGAHRGALCFWLVFGQGPL